MLAAHCPKPYERTHCSAATAALLRVYSIASKPLAVRQVLDIAAPDMPLPEPTVHTDCAETSQRLRRKWLALAACWSIEHGLVELTSMHTQVGEPLWSISSRGKKWLAAYDDQEDN